MPDLSRRHRQPELMDQPNLGADAHRVALRALARVNFLSGSTRILWHPIRDLARKHPTERLRVLDVATGGGDVAVGLWRRAQRSRLPLEVDGCDVSPTAVACAEERARRCGAKVRFFRLDVFSDPLPDGYDVLTCSLFLHHLDEEPAVELLRRMGAAARRLVLINDLERSVAGYRAAYFGTRLLTRSRIVHVDGPMSVEGAFTLDEARQLAERAGLKGVTVERRFPFRFLLKWERK
jgi:2-polyprenyl-3-methyl-5-hydroxy-6-metoxy-1,4-benzoquinol methylase